MNTWVELKWLRFVPSDVLAVLSHLTRLMEQCATSRHQVCGECLLQTILNISTFTALNLFLSY
jgi:hypothetical protein